MFGVKKIFIELQLIISFSDTAKLSDYFNSSSDASHCFNSFYQ